MSDAVLETLFYPVDEGAVDISGKRVIFWCARYSPSMEGLDLTCQSYWKQDAEALEARGFSVLNGDEGLCGYDVALVALPKNAVEARYVLASAIRSVKAGGSVLAAAGNKEGGTRLASFFADFGIADVEVDSRNKCRVAVARVERPDDAAIDAALREGGEQLISGADYFSQPGVFGWNKIDAGSFLLAAYLPERFVGRGADFGCGYGYLSLCVAGRMESREGQLYAVDADVRAVRLCQKNVPSVRGIWADVVGGDGLPHGLDFIIMNPPFHEGKRTDSDIGVAFIEQAARCLKKGGVLWMVANTHLPYEAVLQRSFSSVQKLAQESGFKVFKAVM